MLPVLLIGLSIGFLGSFHCIGMCGPIALSLPILHESRVKRLLLINLYNLGRATTYAVMGLLFGTIGSRFFLTGYQQVFSIAMGVLILVVLIAGRTVRAEQTLFAPLHRKLQQTLGRFLFGKKNTGHFYLIGMLNGLLPCGFVYLAIASAAATGNAAHGAVLMFAFGLGTMPLMFSIMVLGRAISFEMRSGMKKVMPYFIAFTACLLILRGMNLGIPFISPAFGSVVNEAVIGCGH